MLNAMHSLQFQAIRGEILFQSGFKKPVLNVDRTYLNQGDPYLLQQFKKNFTLFISSWYATFLFSLFKITRQAHFHNRRPYFTLILSPLKKNTPRKQFTYICYLQNYCLGTRKMQSEKINLIHSPYRNWR